jgi:site-specific recombinase XerD
MDAMLHPLINLYIMNNTSIDELIQTCLDTLKMLDYNEKVIQCHRRHLLKLKNYMISKRTIFYNESVGEKYQLDLLTDGNVTENILKDISHSINLLNDIFNKVQVRKRRTHPKIYPFPGEFGEYIQTFLEHVTTESRPTKSTMSMYVTALSHFAIRMQHDKVQPDNLDNIAISGFISSLQNTQLYVCGPLRRFLRYLFEMNVIKTDFSIPLFEIKCHRAEKLPSIYSTEEIRKMDAIVEKSSPAGKRNYAIFLLASRLGLRASDIRSLQFNDLDWDQNVINITQCKTQKKIELPLLNIIGEAIIEYVRNGRPKSDCKTIFLTAVAPYTPISIPGLSSIVSRIIYKAGIETKDRHHGSHCLRHSLATRLLQQGTILPVISDVLGHNDSQTTMIYLNVDINSLLTCSLDVPPVADSFYMQKGGWFYE